MVMRQFIILTERNILLEYDVSSIHKYPACFYKHPANLKKIASE